MSGNNTFETSDFADQRFSFWSSEGVSHSPTVFLWKKLLWNTKQMFSRSLSKEFLIKSITRSLIIFKKLRKMTNDFFNHYIFIYMRDSRRVTRNFIRAGKFSRNQGTSTNMSPRAHERKARQGKNMSFFLLETLKTTFKMRNLTRDGHNLGIFFAKIEALFSIFEKGQGRPPPCSPF